jgi:hypothetical protein
VLFCVVLADSVVDRQEGRGCFGDALTMRRSRALRGPVPEKSRTTRNYFIVA